MIILFYGQPASGKTTLADKLNIDLKIRIDGDKWRDVTKNKDYSKEGRLTNLKGAFNMALYLEKEGYIPILSFVTPYKELRQYLKQNANEVVEIYLKYSGDRGRNMNFAKDFEEDEEYNLCFDTSAESIEDCVIKIIHYLFTKR